MDITRSGSQPSGKGSAKNSTGNAGSDSRFEMPDLVSAQHLPSYIERPSDAAGVFAIYPGNGVPPGSEQWTWHEQTMQVSMFGSTAPTTMVRNVVIPTLTMFQPAAGTANSTSLIVAPGGAFRFLTMDAEGYDMARWLTQLGVTVFILRYRVAHMPENETDMLAFMHNLMNVLLFKVAQKRSLRWVMKQQRKPGLGPKKTVAKPFVSYVNTPPSGALIRSASE